MVDLFMAFGLCVGICTTFTIDKIEFDVSVWVCVIHSTYIETYLRERQPKKRSIPVCMQMLAKSAQEKCFYFVVASKVFCAHR